ncbi:MULTISPECIES: MerR family transcriptional regulator [Aerococcus]|uniref:MerR family transcriptional regulator n=2 Tax=Aerococcus TaxID=1375 RepID=A0A178HC05_9LACT|nr:MULTISPECIES: MerR family transcriptional regulator [Aerococcus]KAA9220402.1 MerR family transcriptional regulator [Aerococcus loyolae]KAA9265534.1 MerR family transcriptional regulator [Aerococcus loyolae]MCY3026315.1 MerR family transcriptional regulator [Aerococcus loyolae]MCY3027247.1 MerR family transcriptional regulator [Aerococcus loyolae]MCY3028869.1 MerR family transcriptional regulator [Aerococcus loyolae]
MLRGEVQKQTGLTRKAIEYYEEKGLVAPHREENGYRIYSELDLEKLHKIATLRKLGLNLNEVEDILNNEDQLAVILREKQIKSELAQRKHQLLQRLIAGASIQEINQEIATIEKSETMYERLQALFPGYFGQAFFYAYQPFMNESVQPENEVAFKEYIHYLDTLPMIHFSEEEKDWIEKMASDIDLSMLDTVNESKQAAVEAPAQWFEDNQEAVEAYLAYKESDDFKSSPLYSLNEKIRNYMQNTHYYEKAIPLIRQFSPKYDTYYKKLQQANEMLKDKL